MVAALQTGDRVIGIEKEPTYILFTIFNAQKDVAKSAGTLVIPDSKTQTYRPPSGTIEGMSKTIWLFGRMKTFTDSVETGEIALEFKGIYDSYDEAVVQCSDTSDFVAEVPLNETIDFDNLDYVFPFDPNGGGGLPA